MSRAYAGRHRIGSRFERPRGGYGRRMPGETLILIARHGQTDWNAARRWQGHADRPLSARGEEQARELAERLRGFPLDAVYASDLRRARATAEAVAALQGVPVTELPELREVDTGSWTGLTRPEAEARDPEAFARWREHGEPGWDGGESYDDLSARVVPAVERIGEAHPGGRVLLVAHAGVVRALHAHVLGVDPAAYRRLRPVEPNARLSGVCVEDGRLTRLCRVHELSGLLRPEELQRPLEPQAEPAPSG
jgi:probable phosphoglycerate mutase